MRLPLLLSILTTFLLSNSDCKKKNKDTAAANNEAQTKDTPPATERFTGRLEVAGICKNYTISVTEGAMDKKMIVDEWTDESTQKKYTNAFRLGNPCDFPVTIKAGDTFHFIIDTSQTKECMVCMAYYPTPSKALSIKVVD